MSVPTILYLSMLTSVGVVLCRGPVVSESVDLVEINHVHDRGGMLIFSQQIFWAWDREVSKYHVRAWRLFNGDGKPEKNYRTNSFDTRWNDYGTFRHVKSKHYRESWTQVDLERMDANELPQCERQSLVRGNR